MYYKIFISSALSVIALFILTKLMGKRQISQLSLFDYINGITIGSIAAEMSLAMDEEIIQPLIAMAVYALFAIAISYLGCKSIKLRALLTGRPELLMKDDKIYIKALKRARLDLNEFLSQARISGYYDISQIETAMMETNGMISFLPKSDSRPASCSDLNIKPPKDKPVAAVIIDGVIMKKDLECAGYNEEWLSKRLKSLGIGQAKEVLLATCDCRGELTAYKKTN